MTSTTNQSVLRPELHLSPTSGIIQAPAGVFRLGKGWHVFSQWVASAPGQSRWAHHLGRETGYFWDICDNVLAPVGDETDVRAGSVIDGPDGLHLFYTAVIGEKPNRTYAIRSAVIERLVDTVDSISEDPTAVSGAVRRTEVDLHDCFPDPTCFALRSPCVIRTGESHWTMIAMVGEVNDPGIAVLSSDDLYDWQLEGRLTFAGDPDFIENTFTSPRLLQLRDEVDGEVYDILLLTIRRADGTDYSGYVVGHLQGTEFAITTPWTRFDFGHDFTRPRNTNIEWELQDHNGADFNQALLVGLVNGRVHRDDPTTFRSYREEGWANCLSIPRATTLQGGYLFQTPAPGLTEMVAISERAQLFSGIINTSEQPFTVQLWDQEGRIAAEITHLGSELILDRSMNEDYQGDPVARAELMAADTDSITVLVDGSVVEVFADGGAVAMTSRVYLAGGLSHIEVYGDVLRSYQVPNQALEYS